MALIIATSITEMFSIGALLPFLAVLTDPSSVLNNTNLQPIISALGIESSEQLLFFITLGFGVAAIIAGGMRLLLAWLNIRLSFETGADLSQNIYRRTLYQPYSVHVARNSSEVINGIVLKANGIIYGIINPTLTFIGSFFILIGILIVLIYADPIISTLAFAGFGLIYSAIIWFTRTQKIKNSKRIAHESTQVIKSLQEGLGGIRDVLLDGTQSTYCEIYGAADHPLRMAQGNNLFIAQAPKYSIEALGMVLISALAYILALQQEGLATAIPILGVLALGAQRMLPAMQGAYASITSLQGGQASLEDTLKLLDQPLPEDAGKNLRLKIPFEQNISLNNISFRFSPTTPWVIQDLNLDIAKGDRVGFIGTTGSGKSTLLDIVMGLLEPTKGQLLVDGQIIQRSNQRTWQAHIAHVPQSIFLADSTIEENIAFGQLKIQIDKSRVVRAASQAQIADDINLWPEQYETVVGERGVRLSGGQRQRIGIARAFYKTATVVIFDEATSALDNETEQAVMNAIQSLDKDLTVLIVAHRLTTLKDCTKIVELEGGKIKRTGSYDEIIKNSV